MIMGEEIYYVHSEESSIFDETLESSPKPLFQTFEIFRHVKSLIKFGSNILVK